MKISAIISEYNPFHNGHAYHADTTRRETEADYVLSIMSGNFVQRGEPAVLNKYDRAEMALSGIDAVFELPAVYAISNAGDFAKGAVSILDAMGCIDFLSFGVETDDINVFNRVCDILTAEPESFKSSLRDHMKDGLSYPAARDLALRDVLGDSVSGITSSPNNILAIEYMCALRCLDSKIRPHLIKRLGSYHDNGKPETGFLGASSIRKMISEKTDISDHVPDQSLIKINRFRCITDNSVMDTLLNLRLSEITDKTSIHELSPDMLNRLKGISLPVSFDEAAAILKTRNITYTRSSRALINLIIGISSEDFDRITVSGYAHYANLIAFRRQSSPLIKAVQDTSGIPIINKKSDYRPDNESESLSWYYDCKSTDIYNMLYYSLSGIKKPSELSSNIKII